MGGRVKVDFESHLKLDPFSKVTYILKEGISLHLSIIKTQFRNTRFFEGGLKQYTQENIYVSCSPLEKR